MFWCWFMLLDSSIKLQIFWWWIYKCSWIIYQLMNIFPSEFEQLYFALWIWIDFQNRVWFILVNHYDLAWSVGDYCGVRLGMLQISSTTRNLVPRFKWGKEGNFGRTDLYKVEYLVDNSGNAVKNISRIWISGKSSRAMYEGTIRCIKRMDIRSIPERCVNQSSGYRE